MRVVLVEFAPAGGLFQFSLQIGDALAATGCDVELVTGHDPEFLPRDPRLLLVPILPTWWPKGMETSSRLWYLARRSWRAVRYVTAWLLVCRYLLRDPPDIVQWSEWRYWFEGCFVLLLDARLRRRGTRMAVVAHTPVPRRMGTTRGSDELAGPLLTRAFAAAYRRTDCVFVLGEQSRTRFLEAWPQTPRVEVIRHGTEEIYDASGVPPAEQTEQRALFFGNWNRYKGIDVLLDAWPLVLREVPGAMLTIAGTVGADVDGAGLIAQAQALSGVTVRPSYVEHGDVAALFAGARLVVLPYRHVYQSGIVPLAANFSRPVVATDVGDLPSVVVDGVTGLLVPPERPGDLARAMVRLLENPDEAGRFGRKAHTLVADRASWEQVAASVRRTYDALVRAKS